MPKYTQEQLKAMSVEQRCRLYENARELAGKGNSDAKALILQMEGSGLPYTWDVSLKFNDPDAILMLDHIFSDEGRAAALAATNKGKPAMAGIDPILVRELGDRYSGKNYATVVAGKLVGVLMRQLGFVNAGKKNMPLGSVAQSAETWRRRTA